MAALSGPQRTLQAPSVVLVGDTRPADPGQEAVLAAVLRALEGAASVTVITRQPHPVSRRHGVRALSPIELRRVLQAVHRAAAVVFVGDTLLGARRGRRGKPTVGHLHAALGFAAYAHATRASVLAVGLATADLRSPVARALVRRVVRRGDLTVLRDDDSARNVLRAGALAPVRVGADPAWTVTDDWSPASETDADIVLAASSAELSVPQLRRLCRLTAEAAASGLQVRLDDWGGPPAIADEPTARRVVEWAQSVRVGTPPRSLAEASAGMVGARLVITTRLHGQIAAAIAGAPCLSLEHESGQRALADRLGQISVPLDAPFGRLTAAARAAIAGPAVDNAAVKSEIAAAHASLDLLRLMVGIGDVPVAGVDGLRLEGNTS